MSWFVSCPSIGQKIDGKAVFVQCSAFVSTRAPRVTPLGALQKAQSLSVTRARYESLVKSWQSVRVWGNRWVYPFCGQAGNAIATTPKVAPPTTQPQAIGRSWAGRSLSLALSLALSLSLSLSLCLSISTAPYAMMRMGPEWARPR